METNLFSPEFVRRLRPSQFGKVSVGMARIFVGDCPNT